jgi:hypothetical protein
MSDHDLMALLLEKARAEADFTKAELEVAYTAVMAFRESQMDLACRRHGDPGYLDVIDGEEAVREIRFFVARLIPNLKRLRRNAKDLTNNSAAGTL